MSTTVIQRELETQLSERQWLLGRQLPAVLQEITLQIRMALLAMGDTFEDGSKEKSSGGSTLAISSPNHDNVKGFVSIFGKHITKADVQISLPKQHKIHPVHAKIQPHTSPVLLTQVQDTTNYLHLIVELIEDFPTQLSVCQALTGLSDLGDLLQRTRECFYPDSGRQDFRYLVHRFLPALPENLGVEFFINGENFVTQASLLKENHYSFKNLLWHGLGGPRQSHPSSDKFVLPTLAHQVTVETPYPYLKTALGALAKAAILIKDIRSKLLLFTNLDEEIAVLAYHG
ncbi:hypothetical protein IWQ61_007569 [Dispira simplex]|nr:hypothetical protein IWQ61_007569 [Dispira simplex]